MEPTEKLHWLAELSSNYYHDIDLKTQDGIKISFCSLVLASVSRILKTSISDIVETGQKPCLIFCDFSYSLTVKFLDYICYGEVIFNDEKERDDFYSLCSIFDFDPNSSSGDIDNDNDNDMLMPDIKVEYDDEDDSDHLDNKENLKALVAHQEKELTKKSNKTKSINKIKIKKVREVKIKKVKEEKEKKEEPDYEKNKILFDKLKDKPEDLLKMLETSDESESEIQESEEAKQMARRGRLKICKYCGFRTQGSYKFHMHLVEHVGKIAITCKVCKLECENQVKWHKHRYYIHNKMLMAMCDICGTSVHKHSMKAHIRHMHTEADKGPSKCDMCGKLCKTEATLKAHKKTHEDDRSFICPFCGISFVTKYYLKFHIRDKHEKDGKKFECNVCGKKFIYESMLKKHMNLHTGELTFPCKICHKVFLSKRNVKTHTQSVHQKVVVAICKECGGQFDRIESFYRHAVIHTNMMPFNCPNCDEVFKTKENCRRHRLKIHPLSKDTIVGLTQNHKGFLKQFLIPAKKPDKKDFSGSQMVKTTFECEKTEIDTL